MLSSFAVLFALLVGIPWSSTPLQQPPALQPDASASPEVKRAVALLSAKGILEGYPDGRYYGDRAITRYDMARVLYRLKAHSGAFEHLHPRLTTVGLLAAFSPPPKKQENFYKDIDPNNETLSLFMPQIDEYLQGYPDGYFKGKRAIRRGELAALVTRFIQRMVSPPVLDLEEATFRDVNGDEWWFGAMLIAAGSGIMHGYADGTFQGNRAMTRNELAVTLARLLQPALDMSSPQAAWNSLLTAMENRDERTIKRLTDPGAFKALNSDATTGEERKSSKRMRLEEYQRRARVWRRNPLPEVKSNGTTASTILDLNPPGSFKDGLWIGLSFVKTPQGWRLTGWHLGE